MIDKYLNLEFEINKNEEFLEDQQEKKFNKKMSIAFLMPCFFMFVIPILSTFIISDYYDYLRIALNEIHTTSNIFNYEFGKLGLDSSISGFYDAFRFSDISQLSDDFVRNVNEYNRSVFILNMISLLLSGAFLFHMILKYDNIKSRNKGFFDNIIITIFGFFIISLLSFFFSYLDHDYTQLFDFSSSFAYYFKIASSFLFIILFFTVVVRFFRNNNFFYSEEDINKINLKTISLYKEKEKIFDLISEDNDLLNNVIKKVKNGDYSKEQILIVDNIFDKIESKKEKTNKRIERYNRIIDNNKIKKNNTIQHY